MASRNYAQVAPTAASMAFNAAIYGFGGHSLVTPHAALKRLWWTDERINDKVTRAFVVSKLRGEEREFLDRTLAFGEGLTDDTYMEWILERAKRLFLILAEVGVPDQIFGCIDDSWDDDDLPLSLENVRNLDLSADNDPLLNRRFYDMQFVYLLRELKKGAHIDYGPTEHIPMEHVNTLPPAVALQSYDRVHFPNRPDDVFMRRKYPFTDRDTGQLYKEAFTRDVKKAKALSHEHIVRIWGSYTSESAGFVLSDFVAEHTLATFIDHRTAIQYLRVAQQRRPVMLLEWMHCLSDALASLHHCGIAHTQIRPSNIWIDRENHIAFADVGSLSTFQRLKTIPKTETLDYAAPEQNISKSPTAFRSSSPPVSSMRAFSKLRKLSTISVSTTSSSSGSSVASSIRSNSICTTTASPVTPPSALERSDSLTTLKTNTTPTSPISDPRAATGSGGPRNFSRIVCPSPAIPTGPLGLTVALPFGQTSTLDPDSLRDLPVAAPTASDIYSLACVFLDIVTFILRGKINDFVKFRSTRIHAPGKKKPRTDTSFHSEPDKIAAWIDTLEEDSYRHPEPIYRGMPAILTLIRRMMAQNAAYRPTAVEVRDRLLDILRQECHVEGNALCCARRVWPVLDKEDLTDEGDVQSPFRRKPEESSVPMRALGSDGTVSPMRDRPTSSRTTTTLSSGKKNPLLSTTGRASVSPAGLERPESHVTRESRRSSTASSATARLTSWRTRFLRLR